MQEIITALDVQLPSGEQAKVRHKTLEDQGALAYFYKGVQEFFRLRKNSNLRAHGFFEIVEKKQPEASIGATRVAMCHWFDRFRGWADDPDRSLELASFKRMTGIIGGSGRQFTVGDMYRGRSESSIGIPKNMRLRAV